MMYHSLLLLYGYILSPTRLCAALSFLGETAGCASACALIRRYRRHQATASSVNLLSLTFVTTTPAVPPPISETEALHAYHLVTRQGRVSRHHRPPKLGTFFARLRLYKLINSPNKSRIEAARVDFLGHLISADGVRPNDDRVTALLRMSIPILNNLATYLAVLVTTASSCQTWLAVYAQ